MNNLSTQQMITAVLKTAEGIRHKSYEAYLKRPEELKTEGTYGRQIWRAMRDLFNGEIDEYQFLDDVNNMIDNQFGRAWRQGARDMGVSPAQFTNADYDALADRIAQEQVHMLRLTDDILRARVTGSPPIEQFRSRADMWANRYNDLVNEARIHFGGRRMLEWVLGEAEHCDDCFALSGAVAPADEWAASRWKPQGNNLQCRGYNCRCSLQPTDKAPTGIPM